jgi:hypothetical protein
LRFSAMATAQQQDTPSQAIVIHVSSYYDASKYMDFKVDSRTFMYRICAAIRKKGWGETDLIYQGKVVEQDDTPATLNLQEGSELQAVMLVDEERDPVAHFDGQENDFVELLFDRWDDDTTLTQMRLYRNTSLGYAFSALLCHWYRSMPEYPALCYTFNGHYLSCRDTAESLNLPAVTHVHTFLSDFDQYANRDEIADCLADGSYLNARFNAGPMLTMCVEQWDSKSFCKVMMGINEKFYTVQRMVSELWKKQVPEGQCVALAAPNGTTITCSDTPASLGLGDGDVIEASLTEKVRGQYILQGLYIDKHSISGIAQGLLVAMVVMSEWRQLHGAQLMRCIPC